MSACRLLPSRFFRFLAVLLLAGPVAFAQEESAPRDFDLPAAPLATTLNRIARQAGLALTADATSIGDKTSSPVRGHYSAQEAMRRALEGSGLELVKTDAGTYTLRPAPPAPQAPDASGKSPGAAPESQLPEVTVAGEADRERQAVTEGTGSYTTGSTSTATGLNLSLRETPQSVTVVTRQRIEDQGLTQLSEVYEQIPGLSFAQSGSQGTDSNTVYSRGFVVENYMVDGMPQSTTNSWLLQTADLALYDHVEVVRGPTGLMSGVGSPSATINLVRKRPTQEFQAQASLTAGSWNYYRGDVDVSGPLGEQGNVRGRFVAALQDNESFIDRLTENKQILYGILEIDLASSTTLTLGLEYQEHDADAQARGGLPLYDSDGSLSNFSRSDNSAANWAHSYQTQRAVFVGLDHQFDNEWVLRANAGQTRRKYDDVIGYASGGALDRDTGAGLFLWANKWSSEYIQDALDLQTSGPFDLFGRRHELVVGYNISRMHYDDAPWASWFMLPIPNFYTWDGNTPGKPTWPAGDLTDFEEKQSGLYSTARFRPADALSVIVGARTTSWEQETTNKPLVGTPTVSQRKETGVVTPYAGLVLDLNKNWSVYVSYADIFKPQNNKTPSGDYLNPETGTSIEGGAKSAFFDGRLNFAAALFEVEQDNFAVALPGQLAPDGNQAYRAAKGVKTTGYELEVSGEVAPNWQLFAGYTQRTSKDAEGEAVNTDAPRNQFKLFTSYRLASVGNGLTVGGGVRWQGSVYSDAIGPNGERFTQEDYAVVDLMARYPLGKDMTISANLDNVFDESYYTSTWSSYYGMPRSVRVTLGYKF